MFGQVIMADEGLPTFVTLVAFIIMVDSEVESVQRTVCSFIGHYNNDSQSNTMTNIKHLQNSLGSPVGAAMTETLATDATEVRLLPTVDSQVLPQCCPIRGNHYQT